MTALKMNLLMGRMLLRVTLRYWWLYILSLEVDSKAGELDTLLMVLVSLRSELQSHLAMVSLVSRVLTKQMTVCLLRMVSRMVRTASMVTHW